MSVTTHCQCWILRRRDGHVQGFTDHDHPLEIEGVACEAVAALDASEARAALGLGADAQDVAGALRSDAIAEADIAAGRLDGAEVSVWRVDWRRPAERVLLRRATLGEIVREDGAFRAELRGLAHGLDAADVRRFTRRCDAAFGDRRCGVDLAQWTVSATVEAVPDELTLVCPAAAGEKDDHFAHGRVLFVDGANADLSVEVSASRGARIHLWRAPAFPVAAGTRIRLQAGCDKGWNTCRAKFGNGVNFRGFPHVPGTDFALGYAAGGAVHDGGALVE